MPTKPKVVTIYRSGRKPQVKISFRLPREYVMWLEHIAKNEKTTVSEFIRTLIEVAIEEDHSEGWKLAKFNRKRPNIGSK